MVGEVIFSAERALEARSRLERLIALGVRNASSLHAEVSTILDAAARIRGFLRIDPASRKSLDSIFVALVEELQKVLDVASDNPINSVIVRNHDVHFDERLIRWALFSTNRTFGRHMIGSLSDAMRIGLNREDVMSLFDTETGQYVFWDDEANIFALCEAVTQVLERATSYQLENPYLARIIHQAA